MKKRIFLLSTICFIYFIPADAYKNAKTVIWKSTYYHAIPQLKNISSQYCQTHSPGTFIGKVNDQLKFGATTDHNVRLTHFSFHVKKIHGIYFLEGSLTANGREKNHRWQDHLHYSLYKLTEYGNTFGVWYSEKCKGLYAGQAIR